MVWVWKNRNCGTYFFYLFTHWLIYLFKTIENTEIVFHTPVQWGAVCTKKTLLSRREPRRRREEEERGGGERRRRRGGESSVAGEKSTERRSSLVLVSRLCLFVRFPYLCIYFYKWKIKLTPETCHFCSQAYCFFRLTKVLCEDNGTILVYNNN